VTLLINDRTIALLSVSPSVDGFLYIPPTGAFDTGSGGSIQRWIAIRRELPFTPRSALA